MLKIMTAFPNSSRRLFGLPQAKYDTGLFSLASRPWVPASPICLPTSLHIRALTNILTRHVSDRILLDLR